MWILLTLSAAFIFAVVNTIDKHVVSKYKMEPIIFVTVISCLGLIIGLALLLFVKIPLNWLILLALLNGAFYPTVNLLYFKALRLEEVSRVVPWFSLYIALTVIGAAIFLGETLSLKQYLGIAILLSGIFMLTIKKGFKVKAGRWMIFMFCAGLIIAAQSLLEKYLLNKNFGTLPLFTIIQLGAFLGFLPYGFFNWAKIKTAIFTRSPVLKIITFNQTLTISGTLTLIAAISLGLVSLVSVLESLQYLFLLVLTLLISLFYPKILKEELATSIVSLKVIAVLLVIAGIYLIS